VYAFIMAGSPPIKHGCPIHGGFIVMGGVHRESAASVVLQLPDCPQTTRGTLGTVPDGVG